MHKYIYIIASLFILFNTFDLQSESANHDKALGLALFAGTATACTALIKYQQLQVVKVDSDKSNLVSNNSSTHQNSSSSQPKIFVPKIGSSDDINIKKTKKPLTTTFDYLDLAASTQNIIKLQETAEATKININNEALKQNFRKQQQSRMVSRDSISTINQSTPLLRLKDTPEFKSHEYQQKPNKKSLAQILNQKFPNSYRTKINSELSIIKAARPNQLKIRYTDEWHHNKEHVLYRSTTLEALEPKTKLDDISQLKMFLEQHIESKDPIINSAKRTHNCVKISTERRFVPKKPCNRTNNIHLILTIHGTGAEESTSFGDDEDKSLHSICYAQRTAIETETTAKLLTVKWNGAYDKTARTVSGKNLAQLLIEKVKQENPNAHITVDIIAHSYGCAVGLECIAEADKIAKDTLTPLINFRNVFFLASPRDPYATKISNRVKVTHLYGDLDGIATGETWRLTQPNSTDLHDPSYHLNIRCKRNAENTNHRSIKDMIRYLFDIITIKKYYPGEPALVINTVKEKVTIRDNKNKLNEIDEEIEEELITASQDTYTSIAFVDRSKKDPSTREHNEKTLRAENKFKDFYPGVNIHERPTFEQALRSERENTQLAEGALGYVTGSIINILGVVERILPKNGTPSLSRSPQTTTSKSSSPSNSKSITPPPSPTKTP